MNRPRRSRAFGRLVAGVFLLHWAAAAQEQRPSYYPEKPRDDKAVYVAKDSFPVDDEFSNSYEHWKKMGSPQKPTPAQYSELEQSGQLQTVSAPGPIAPQGGKAKVSLSLPLHGVSPIQLTW
jgi:hypothetical protein